MNNTDLLSNDEKTIFRNMLPQNSTLISVGVARLYFAERGTWQINSTGLVTLERQRNDKRTALCFYDWKVCF